MQASLSELPWQAVLCPQAIEDTEGRRLMDALKAEEEVTVWHTSSNQALVKLPRGSYHSHMS